MPSRRRHRSRCSCGARPARSNRQPRPQRWQCHRALMEHGRSSPCHCGQYGAPVHSTSRPSAFAAFRLMTSLNLVGCCTGRSVGLALPSACFSPYPPKLAADFGAAVFPTVVRFFRIHVPYLLIRLRTWARRYLESADRTPKPRAKPTIRHTRLASIVLLNLGRSRSHVPSSPYLRPRARPLTESGVLKMTSPHKNLGPMHIVSIPSRLSSICP